jgi:oxalate decarboxylase/phosphoglucose isomerase-like protein (cupin superfamily)
LFNIGVYEEISLSAWLGGNPGSLLMDNFGVSKEVVDRLPRKPIGISGRRG